MHAAQSKKRAGTDLPLPGNRGRLGALQKAIEWLRREDPAAAERELSALCRKAPKEPAPAYFLGLARIRSGRPEQAVEPLERACTLAPRAAAVWELLGHLQRQLGGIEAAEEAYRRALDLEPGRAAAAHGLGNCLLRTGRERNAVAPLADAARIEPGEARYHRDLGTALIHKGDIAEARRELEHAVGLAPQDALALANLGWAADLLGDLDEAERCYRQAIALQPRIGTPWYKLARRGLEVDAEAAERLLDDPSVSDDSRADLHFALGEVCRRRGEDGRAFEHYRRGNELVRPAHDARHRAELALAPTVFADREFLRQRAADPAAGAGCVFIVGMPRSGTSLVEQILAAHPRVRPLGECLYWGDAALALGRETTGDGGGAGRGAARGAALGADLGTALRADLGADRGAALVADSGADRGVDRGADFRADRTRAYPWALMDLGPEQLHRLAAGYAAEGAAVADSEHLTTDKAPANYLFLPLIALALPAARIVCLRRDPRDVALSLFFTRFRGGSCTFSYDLDDLASTLIEFETAMGHWQRHLPLPMHELGYERLVGDFESEARRLLDFCGLAWDPAVLDFHRSERVCLTASNEQVRRPIYSSSIGRWRRWERELTPLIERLRAAGCLPQDESEAD